VICEKCGVGLLDLINLAQTATSGIKKPISAAMDESDPPKWQLEQGRSVGLAARSEFPSDLLWSFRVR